MWYVRKGHGPRVRLRTAPGRPEFGAEYRAAIDGEPPPVKPGRAAHGTLAWLVERYRETSNWLDLSVATRRQRENIFRQIIAASGTKPFTRVNKASVAAGRDKRRATPAQARHYLDTLRGLFQWAKDADLVKVDPTEGVKTPRKATADAGFEVWTEDDVAAYLDRWPVGTRARVAFDVLRFTGMRRGDACKLGRPHVRAGVITLRTAKTGELVTIRMPDALAESLAAGPIGDLTYITGQAGRPLTKESFGNEFRDWCRAAGVSKSAHGLRKLAATIAAENGATEGELEAMFGWRGGRMASHYTKSADRKRLGIEGSRKLPGTSAEHSIPAPNGKVRESEQKDK